jgi:hypothetical protein
MNSFTFVQVTLVKDINTLPGRSSPSNIVEAGGIIFFTCTTPAYGTELRKTHGTVAGTVMAKDI